MTLYINLVRSTRMDPQHGLRNSGYWCVDQRLGIGPYQPWVWNGKPCFAEVGYH